VDLCERDRLQQALVSKSPARFRLQNHIEADSQQNEQIGESVTYHTRPCVEGLGQEVRTTSESVFLDIEGFLSFNGISISPSCL
jgi:hypothetical protein